MHEYAALISAQTRKYMRSVVTRRFSSTNFCKSTCWLCSCRIISARSFWEQKNSPALVPRNLPQVLGKQTLSQYLSPVSVYSAQRTTYFNSHLVRRSLLSTAMQCICQSPLQNLTVLHAHTTLMDICTDIFPFLLLLNIYNVSIFIHMHFSVLQKGKTFFQKSFY